MAFESDGRHANHAAASRFSRSSQFASQGKSERGRALLEPAFKQFKEGFDTVDLKAAERVLATLD
jgi:hypothetical protein